MLIYQAPKKSKLSLTEMKENKRWRKRQKVKTIVTVTHIAIGAQLNLWYGL